MYFEIKDNHTCDHVSTYDGDWQEDNSYYYESATISAGPRGQVALFPGEVEPKRFDDIYVVGVSYSDGDSYGRAYNKHVLLWAFTNKDRAIELEKLLEQDAQNEEDIAPIDFYGAKISCLQWKGFFETFNGVFIKKLTVEK